MTPTLSPEQIAEIEALKTTSIRVPWGRSCAMVQNCTRAPHPPRTATQEEDRHRRKSAR